MSAPDAPRVSPSLARWTQSLALACAIVNVGTALLAIRAWVKFEDVVDRGSLFLSFGAWSDARDDLDIGLTLSLLVALAFAGCLLILGTRMPKARARNILAWSSLVLVGEVVIRAGVVWASTNTAFPDADEIRRGYICIMLGGALLGAGCIVLVFVTNATARTTNAMSSTTSNS